MPDRPLLILPTPERIDPPKGQGFPRGLVKPDPDRQVAEFTPVFDRLQRVLGASGRESLSFRDDPTALVPERVVVFEVADSVQSFENAVERMRGLDFMLEIETEADPDDRFSLIDERRATKGQPRMDKPVPGRFYLTMPDTRALRELSSLWRRWSNGEGLPRGLTPFRNVFEQLRTLRPWGPEDRILDETINYWRESLVDNSKKSVRTEVELWFASTDDGRRAAFNRLAAHVAGVGGTVVHEAVIREIAYHGALVDVPAEAVEALLKRQNIPFALADEVMFLRPQSIFSNDLDLRDNNGAVAEQNDADSAMRDEPIAALLDGMPVQYHERLKNKLSIDDPDGIEAQSIVAGRVHGTAMASLILHGDIHAGERALTRRLYVRPVMSAPASGPEQTRGDRLLIDTIHRAVLRMKGSAGEEPAAPTVFLVNLSMGDRRRPFTRLMSPLARLLDYLSAYYGILFLVSAGNITDPLQLPDSDFDTWDAFEAALPDVREQAVLKALNRVQHQRTLLSPAESLNAITVGAQHHDWVDPRPRRQLVVDPLGDHMLPNVSSALGLGYRRSVKPEICLPGGREHLRMRASGGGIKVGFGEPQGLFGLCAAAPDRTGSGQLNKTALSGGTSSATALATRAAHRIFDALMDRDGGSRHADMPAEFYAVVVKALLVHRARWSDKARLLQDICGPPGGNQWLARTENACRFLGFGVPDIAEVLECASNRATLVGYGALASNRAHKYRLPLPRVLEKITDPRTLTISLAWFSPVKPGHQRYRCVRLEASPDEPNVALGVERRGVLQPEKAMAQRGSLFHARYQGDEAVPFINDGHLSMTVIRKDDAGGVDDATRYGVAVTIESEALIPIYEQIEQRLRVAARARS